MSSFSGTARGGCAPRRGRGGGYRPFTKVRESVKPDIEKYPLGQLLQTFRDSDLRVEAKTLSHKVSITNCDCVASYNWLSEKAPTIIIPGIGLIANLLVCIIT